VPSQKEKKKEERDLARRTERTSRRVKRDCRGRLLLGRGAGFKRAIGPWTRLMKEKKKRGETATGGLEGVF